MARANNLKGKAPPLTTYSWSLNDPGMGEYERAGLAGLYLSLTAADVWSRAMLDTPVKQQAGKLKEMVSWGFSDDISVQLDWSRAESTAAAFDAIMRWAWQIRDGVLFLPAVHRKQAYLDNNYLRLPTHKGLMGTFLQHNKAITLTLTESEKDLPKLEKPKARSDSWRIEYYDEDRAFSLQYQRIHGRAELAYWKKCGGEILKRGNFRPDDSVERPSWLYPGSAPRFGKAERNWCGSARICFLLAFAPMSSHFIKLPDNLVRVKGSNRRSKKQNWAFIVPQVRSLSGLRKSALRRSTTPANWPFQSEVAGLQDAVLQYMATNNLTVSGDLEVIATVMGEVAHYKNQKVRKNHLRFSLAHARAAVKKYRCFNRVFSIERIIKMRNETADDDDTTMAFAFIKVPSCRERTAANLLEGREWYRELAFVPSWQGDEVREESKKKKDISPEHLWFNKLRKYERIGLMTLTEESGGVWSDEQSRSLVVNLFHRALRRLLNEEEFAAKQGSGRLVNERWDDKVDQIRRQLMGAKTQSLCRAGIVNLLGEANSRRRKWTSSGGERRVAGPLFWQENGDEQELSAELWRMLNDERDYAKVRDLALLALITFTDGRLGQPNNMENQQ